MTLSSKFISATAVTSTFDAPIPAPYIRKKVLINEKAAKAQLSVCGLGFYRLFLDGNEITKGHMSPYISNSDNIIDYDVYDLTEKLTVGEHVFGFILGNGMQDCFGGFVWDFEQASFRTSPKLAFCLELTDKDGNVCEIEADESCKCADSPIIFNDLRYGEEYDASKEINGWAELSFDDSGWKNVISVETPKGEKRICLANPILETQRLDPVDIHPDTFTSRFRNDFSMSGYLYDFGVNAAGIPLLKIKGKKGQKIEMLFGEHILPNGHFTVDNLTFNYAHFAHLPFYTQKDTYICKGEGIEEWSPSFTYHGYRYVLVSGITEEQATKDLLQYRVMNTELNEIGNFSCSDPILNKLQKMVRVATLANFYHFPTDCPHREKNGWTADAALSVEHTLLNLTPENNYKEWEAHLCAALNEAGALPGIVPTGGWGFHWGNGPAWDQALLVIPYMLYRYRGDIECAKSALPSLLRYVKYLTTRIDDRGLLEFGLGDWCSPVERFVPSFQYRGPLVVTDSILAMDICEKTAFLFDKTGDKEGAEFCSNVASSLKKAIREHLIDFNTMTAYGLGTCTPGSQTSQAMAIFYGIFTEEERPEAVKVLVRKLKEEKDHIDTGVLGAKVIFHVLSDNGYADYAYKVMTDPVFPSYGEVARRGDTAMPECFMPYDFSNSVPSLNHHFFGDISAWFIKAIAGINLNPDAENIHYVNIAPHFISDLTHAEAFHVAPDGKIEVKWERIGENQITLNLTIPENMTYDLTLSDGWTVKEQNGTVYTVVK